MRAGIFYTDKQLHKWCVQYADQQIEGMKLPEHKLTGIWDDAYEYRFFQITGRHFSDKHLLEIYYVTR